MKKILTLTFVITALFLSAIAVQAQPYNKYKKVKAVKYNKHKNNNYNKGFYNKHKNNNYNKGFYNNRGVYVYHTTQYKWIYGRKYKNIYKVKVFPNGRKNVQLVNSVLVPRYRTQTYYQTKTIRQGWRLYRVTYKVTRYPSGYVSKRIVKKQRLNRFW
jgi:hypothetical protein